MFISKKDLDILEVKVKGELRQEFENKLNTLREELTPKPKVKKVDQING